MNLFEQPNYVGRWHIGGHNALCISAERRPRWLTRWLCKALLQWEWEDFAPGKRDSQE